uniref:Elongation of very long chain fatty acids protein n=1 Tax=Nothobranchius furzeri TaxID=105023 RepID=A0A8C6KYS8_NOTFU
QGNNAVTVWQKVQLFYRGILESGDKRTDEWPLVYSPVPITCMLLCYLIIICVGPKLMPFNLKPVLIVYNFTMVCLSAYMFYEFTASSWLSRYSLLFQPVDYSDSPLAMRMARVCWWFYLSKVVELSDTIFFILSKKNGQLTFLHVYHHATITGGLELNMWLGIVVCLQLSYLYYGLAALGLSKHLWWKRHLTSLQLAMQFNIISSFSPFF